MDHVVERRDDRRGVICYFAVAISMYKGDAEKSGSDLEGYAASSTHSEGLAINR